jgi:hypothetical protein
MMRGTYRKIAGIYQHLKDLPWKEMPPDNRIALLQALAGLKPMTEIRGVLNLKQEDADAIKQMGLTIVTTQNPEYQKHPDLVPKESTWIIDERKVKKILKKEHVPDADIKPGLIDAVDGRTKGKLFGYHKEEIDYFSRLQSGSPYQADNLNWVTALAKQSSGNTVKDVIKKNANAVISRSYGVLTPPTYSRSLKRVIDKRADIVKKIDPELFRNVVYMGVQDRLNQFINEPEKPYNAESVKEGRIDSSALQKAEEFAKMLYPQLRKIVQELK